MEALKCIIIDDEYTAVKGIELALQNIDFKIEIVGSTTLAEEGINLIKNNKFDILFLDFNLMVMDAFDLLDQVDYLQFDTIFITGEVNEKERAFEYSVFDYLLKPISIRQINNTIRKYVQKKESFLIARETLQQIQVKYEVLRNNIFDKMPTKIGFPTKVGIEYVDLNDIIYIEYTNSLCYIYCEGQRIIETRKKVKEIETELPQSIFFRIDHPTIVNMTKIKSYIKIDSEILLDSGAKLKVSKRRRVSFLNTIEGSINYENNNPAS